MTTFGGKFLIATFAVTTTMAAAMMYSRPAAAQTPRPGPSTPVEILGPLPVPVTVTGGSTNVSGAVSVTGNVAITNGVNNPVPVTVPGVSPVAETCEGLLSCQLYTVPENMVLVVETVSYLVQVGSPCTEPPIPTIHTIPPNPISVWLPRPSPGTGQFATIYSDVAAVRLYIPAGATLNFLFNVPGQSCSQTQPVTHATMYGHLVAAGSP